MAEVIDKAKDAALDYIKNNTDKVVYCDADPATYSDADTLKESGGNKVGERSVTSGNFTKGDGDTDGRKLTLDQGTFTGDTGGSDVDATHAVGLDVNNSEITFVSAMNDGTQGATKITVADGLEYTQMAIDVWEVGDPSQQ